MSRQSSSPSHQARSQVLLVETIFVFGLLALLSASIFALDAPRVFLFLSIVAQGCWFHRLYVVGHEASHRKLFPNQLQKNERWGQLLLLPILLPLRIHRKIHAFHHAHNRRDVHTSSLEIFPLSRNAGPLRRLLCNLTWFIAVFCGGHFFHGLISVMLFLWLPLPLAKKVSPAFRGWKAQDRFHAIASFGAGLALHLSLYWLGGQALWFVVLGAPMLVFAWVYSLLVYIYHYRTSYGPKVQYHVRRLDCPALVRWWLLNFNEHIAHHWNPNIPWYELPEHQRSLPDEFANNSKISGLLQAILFQLRGVVFVDLEDEPEIKTSK